MARLRKKVSSIIGFLRLKKGSSFILFLSFPCAYIEGQFSSWEKFLLSSVPINIPITTVIITTIITNTLQFISIATIIYIHFYQMQSSS